MPGMEKQVRDADIDERQFDRIQAIITSMTAKERAKPEIINGSRRKRIAAGCGQSVEEVNRLLRQYEQIKKMMKQMNKTKHGKRMGGFNMPGGFPMM